MLYEQTLAETNHSARRALYREADQLVINDAAVVPLWYDMVLRLTKPYIKDFSANSLNLLELRRTYMLNDL